MNPHQPYRLSAVPQTLHARLEIANAIRTLTAQDENALAKRRTQIEAIRREREALKLGIQEAARGWLALVKAELRSELKKYSPNQPRVPAGNSDGGQWTSEGGAGAPNGSTNGSEAKGFSRPLPYAALDTGTRTDETRSQADFQVAAGSGSPGYPVDLAEEERFGGHTIARHVGKSAASLLSEVHDEQASEQKRGDYSEDIRVGSFPSLEAANKLSKFDHRSESRPSGTGNGRLIALNGAECEVRIANWV